MRLAAIGRNRQSHVSMQSGCPLASAATTRPLLSQYAVISRPARRMPSSPQMRAMSISSSAARAFAMLSVLPDSATASASAVSAVAPPCRQNGMKSVSAKRSFPVVSVATRYRALPSAVLAGPRIHSLFVIPLAYVSASTVFAASPATGPRFSNALPPSAGTAPHSRDQSFAPETFIVASVAGMSNAPCHGCPAQDSTSVKAETPSFRNSAQTYPGDSFSHETFMAPVPPWPGIP